MEYDSGKTKPIRDCLLSPSLHVCFTHTVFTYNHISERNATFVETNTAIMAWKIADIITLSHYITMEMFCAKLQGNVNTVCYHKGIMYWCCICDGIANTVSTLPLKSISEELELHHEVSSD